MIAGLGRFVDQLRRAGLAASPAEWLDALRAVQLVGLADRARFRAALRCALAKGTTQGVVFDRVFDQFFAVPRAGSRHPREGSRGGLVGRGGPNRRGEVQPFGRAPGPQTMPPAPAAEADRSTRPTSFGVRDGARDRRERLRRVVLAPSPSKPSGGPPRAEPAGFAARPERQLLRRWLSTAEERAIAALVPRIVERIRLRSGRRLARHPRGALYLRRVFRDNLRHGGVPWILPRRRVRPRRSQVVLLIDVSWSAARAAALFAAIAGGVLQRVRRVKVLLFVDRVVDATDAVDRWLRGSSAPRSTARLADPAAAAPTARPQPASAIGYGGTSFAQVLQSLPGLNLEAPSDYGRSFHALLRSPLRPASPRTVLVVLGDGRTNRLDPQAWAFEELASRCGFALWLVSEEAARWGSADSALAAYLPHVDVAVEARDIAGLERGVREMVRCL